MNHHKSELYFLLVLLAGISILTFFIFEPFLYALILAVVFATVFGPIHRKALIITRGGKSVSALLATACVLLVVVVPLAFLGVQIFQEATQLYSSLVNNGGATDFSRNITDAIAGFIELSPVPIELSTDVNQYLRQGLNWLLQHLGPLFANAAKIVMGVFIFLVALYYLFKDGYKLKKAVIALSPLQDVHDEVIFNKTTVAIISVTKGNLAIALIQGILTAAGFALFGVPNVALLGSVAALAALVPSVGTSIVILPAILYLYLIGDTPSALGLFIWGMLAVGLVDNFLGPMLVERGMRLHPFLILLSILGGIGFFGPLGFLMGPLILSLLFAFLEIYSTISKEHRD